MARKATSNAAPDIAAAEKAFMEEVRKKAHEEGKKPVPGGTTTPLSKELISNDFQAQTAQRELNSRTKLPLSTPYSGLYSSDPYAQTQQIQDQKYMGIVRGKTYSDIYSRIKKNEAAMEALAGSTDDADKQEWSRLDRQNTWLKDYTENRYQKTKEDCDFLLGEKQRELEENNQELRQLYTAAGELNGAIYGRTSQNWSAIYGGGDGTDAVDIHGLNQNYENAKATAPTADRVAELEKRNSELIAEIKQIKRNRRTAPSASYEPTQDEKRLQTIGAWDAAGNFVQTADDAEIQKKIEEAANRMFHTSADTEEYRQAKADKEWYEDYLLYQGHTATDVLDDAIAAKRAEIEENEQKIQQMNASPEELNGAIYGHTSQNWSAIYGDGDGTETVDIHELNRAADRVTDLTRRNRQLEQDIERLEDRLWNRTREDKYAEIAEKAQYSKYNKGDNALPSANSTEDLIARTYITDEEIKTYNYIYNTQGKDEAKKYMEWLEYALHERQQAAIQDSVAEWTEESIQKGVAAPHIASVLTNLASGLGTLDAVKQGVVNAITGNDKPIDYNTWAFTPRSITKGVRNTTYNYLNETYGTTDMGVLGDVGWGEIYNIGMSMLDSAAVAAVSPLIGGAGTALLGGSAATDTMVDAHERGATDGESVLLGIMSGVFETLFEKYSLDSVIKLSKEKSLNAIFKNMFKQGITEASEETWTTLANTAAEIFVLGDLSSFKQNIRKYKDAGYSDTEAQSRAWGEVGSQTLIDAVGGFISGVGFGAGSNVIGVLKNETAQELRNTADKMDADIENSRLTGQNEESAIRAIEEMAEKSGGQQAPAQQKINQDGLQENASRDTISEREYARERERAERAEPGEQVNLREAYVSAGDTLDTLAVGDQIILSDTGEAAYTVTYTSENGVTLSGEAGTLYIPRGTMTQDSVHVAEQLRDGTFEVQKSTAETYSISRTTDNKPFVIVEEDILDGVPEKDWVKTVKKNLQKKFPNGITVGNNKIKINAQTTGEITSSEYSKWLRDHSPAKYADKLRATNNSDEILAVAQDWIGEGLKHPRQDNIREFARGSVLMRIGENDYAADVVVATTKSSSNVLYDIVNISPTTINEWSQTQTAATIQKDISDRTSAPSSTDNIPQDSGKSNRENMSKGEENGRDNVSGGSEERNAGAHTGKSDGRMAGWTRKRKSAAERGRDGVKRKNTYKDFRGEIVDAQKYGVHKASKKQTARVIPRAKWDARLRQIAKRIEAAGKKAVFVYGSVLVEEIEGRPVAVQGVRTGTRILVQVDSLKYAPEEIADHEIYHDKSRNNPGMNETIRENIRSGNKRAEFDRVVARYIEALRDIIPLDKSDGEAYKAGMQKIIDEVFADAYAGMNRYGVQADIFQSDVNAELDNRNEGRTQETRGPPDGQTKNTTDNGGEDQYSITDRISQDMTDEERYAHLKDRTLNVPSYNAEKIAGIDNGDFQALKRIGKGDAFKILRKIGEQFGVFKDYHNADVSIDFGFSKRNLQESINKQNGEFQNYARMMSVFDDVIENAIGIEAHSQRYNYENEKGTHIRQTYVFASAFQDGTSIVPVILEVREFSDGTKSSLYIAVNLHGIERSRILEHIPPDTNAEKPYSLPASNIRLADLFANVNTEDGRMLKYIPDDFLDDAQKAAKQEAIAEQREYVAKKNEPNSADAEAIKQAVREVLQESGVIPAADAAQSNSTGNETAQAGTETDGTELQLPGVEEDTESYSPAETQDDLELRLEDGTQNENLKGENDGTEISDRGGRLGRTSENQSGTVAESGGIKQGKQGNLSEIEPFARSNRKIYVPDRGRRDSRGITFDKETAERLRGTSITDQKGRPLAVYHSTQDMSFETFAKGDTGFHFGSQTQAKTRAQQKGGANRTIGAYLNIQNPVYVPSDIMNWKACITAMKLYAQNILTEEEYLEVARLADQGLAYDAPASVRLREMMAEKGYDGIVYENGYEGAGKSYIALYPGQVVTFDNGLGLQLPGIEDESTQTDGTELTLPGVEEDTARATTADMSADEIRYSYAGRHALTAELDALAEAERMEEAGETPEAIWQETGWVRGLAGQWRFEIDDGAMARDLEDELLTTILDHSPFALNEKHAYYARDDLVLEDVIKHEGLFAAYPELRRMPIHFNYTYGSGGGSYYPDTKEIEINDISPYDIFTMRVIVHEIQHAIQDIEGYTDWHKGYPHLEELEAKDAEHRIKLYPEERRAAFPQYIQKEKPWTFKYIQQPKIKMDTESYSPAETQDDLELRLEDGGKLNADRSFAEQVDAVLSGKASAETTHLNMGATPEIYGKYGFDTSLPILVTAKHIRTMHAKTGENVKGNAHNLTKGQIKALPEAIKNPAMVMISRTRPNNSIVIVTTLTNSQGCPIIVSLMADGQGNYNDIEIDANIMTSAYGKDNFRNFVIKAFAEDRILNIDEKGSRTLQNTPGVQFPNNIPKGDFTNNIRKFSENVNRERMANNEELQLPGIEADTEDYSPTETQEDLEIHLESPEDEIAALRAQVEALQKENANLRGDTDPHLDAYAGDKTALARERVEAERRKAELDRTRAEKKRLESVGRSKSKSPMELDNVKDLLNDTAAAQSIDTDADYGFMQLVTDKGISNSKDLGKNLDEAAGRNTRIRKVLNELIEKPFYAAKKRYAQNVKQQMTDLYEYVVKGCGIKMGSPEAAAVQWYGEKTKPGKIVEKQVKNRKGETVTIRVAEDDAYTLEDLKKEFPKKWQDIVKAERYFREHYDAYIGRVNAALEQAYPHAGAYEKARYENYLTTERFYKKQAEVFIRAAADIQADIDRMESRRRDADTAAGAELEVQMAQKQRQLERLRRRQTNFEVIAERAAHRAAHLKAAIDSGEVLKNRRLIPRKDYFHHFQEMDQKFGGLKNIISSPNDIDPRLLGVSEYTKPNSKWAAFLQRRGMGAYKADAVAGFMKYVQSAEYIIHMDPFIAQARGQIRGMAEATAESRNANNFILWYTNWVNEMAGKGAPWDRPLKNMNRGRTVLAGLNWLNGRVKANAVMGNMRSAVAQFFNLPNAMVYVKNPLDWSRGVKLMAEYVANRNGARELFNESGFLTERYLDSALNRFDTGVLNVPRKMATWLLTIGDEVTTKYMWAAAYAQAVRKGVADPIAHADDVARRSVAGRGIGEVPLTQQSQIVKLIAPFQVEVNNQWQIMKKLVRDMNPHLAKTAEGRKIIAGAASGLVLMSIVSFLMNSLTRALFGFDVSFDPIYALIDAISDWDDEESVVDNIGNVLGRLAGEIVSNAPMGAQAASVVIPDSKKREKFFGESDPTRFGTGNIGLEMLIQPVTDMLDGKDFSDSLKSAILNIGLPFGGKQAERFVDALQETGILPHMVLNTEEGLDMWRDNASYSTNGSLRFPIDTHDPWNVIKECLWGAFSTKEGMTYLENGDKPLDKEWTAVYREMRDAGADGADAYVTIRNVNDAEKNVEKYTAIIGSSVPEDAKEAALRKIIGKEESAQAKLDEVLAAGISVSDYLTYLVGVAGMDGKDENGKSVSGLLAARKLEYLDAMELTGEQKLTLYLNNIAKEGKQEDIETALAAGLDEEDAYELMSALGGILLSDSDASAMKQKYTAIQEVSDDANEALLMLQLVSETQYEKSVSYTSQGGDATDFVQFLAATYDMESDKDADGKIISGKREKDKKMEYIDSMDISDAEKDLLYLLYWKESKIDEAPWR